MVAYRKLAINVPEYSLHRYLRKLVHILTDSREPRSCAVIHASLELE